MQKEIPFKQEELASIINGAVPSKGHKKLLAALHARYPEYTFKLGAERDGIFNTGGIVTATGERVASNLKEWMTQVYEECGKDPRLVWDTYKGKGWLATEQQLERFYLVIQYGSAPADFFQIELYLSNEVTESELFCQKPFCMPNSFRDLFDGWNIGPDLHGNSVEQKPVRKPYYQFRRVHDIAAFVQQAQALETQERIARLPEIQKKVVTVIETGPGAGPARQEPLLKHAPNYLGYKRGLTRLMEDWESSSAGRSGQIFSDHWSLELSEYEYEGRRRMEAIPVWVTTKRLPEIRVKDSRDIGGLISKIEKLDEKVGVPFGWFFFMLHGNRVIHTVGEAIYHAVKRGQYHLPGHDEAILSAWFEKPYNF